MFNYLKNITAVFTALIMIAGGNFINAIVHGDCIQVDGGYISCEMECCKKNPCIADYLNSEVIIKDDSRTCCNLHIEQSLEQNGTIPAVTVNNDVLRTLISSIVINKPVTESADYSSIIHKFKTTNIFLRVSNLRI